MLNQVNQHKEIFKKLYEIEGLEEEFDKGHSYTRSMLLGRVWKECKGLGKKYNLPRLIEIAEEKISLYMDFIEGDVSKEIVKDSIKSGIYYLLGSEKNIVKVASEVIKRKSELLENKILYQK